MEWSMLTVTRRCFALSLLIAPLACLGCDGDGVSVNAKAGEKRRQKLEALQEKAELKRKSGAKMAPRR